MDLLNEPWIDVFTHDGPATVSLLDLARNLGDIIDVVSGDPLEDAAILRMLMAADLVSDGQIAGWLTETRGAWNLFDSAAPFWQNPQLREHLGDRSIGPAVTLSYRNAGNGSVLLDHHHNETGLRSTPAAAARALMMRQQFSVGGIQPFPEKIYGVKSAKAAVAASRPFVWIDAGNLAATLTANRTSGPTGTFHHTWIGGRPGRDGAHGGQADALTWQARSVLLIPDADGYVTGVSITEGSRYGDHTDPHLIPHTTYTRQKKNDPHTAWTVHIDRPGWRQLLTAVADPTAPGVLAADPPAGTRIRLAGLASLKSRIDGPVTGSLPAPHISRADTAALGTAIADTRKYIIGRVIAAGRIAAPSSNPTAPGAWWKRLAPTNTRWNSDVEPVVRRALTGEISIPDAVDALHAHADRYIDEVAAALASTSPAATAAATTPPTTRKEGANPR
ncbi:MAG: type I-E CRISPR-associated protein Cse1/CasA [Rhodococcus sp. (in: high G+C Gram-positive bacteria)]|uniref:type I-E CRISPR-associated protein Cse1/CasA n=1 Tax=Rhodococcus sp. TaxID=1831 RepID=UPI003BB5FD5F